MASPGLLHSAFCILRSLRWPWGGFVRRLSGRPAWPIPKGLCHSAQRWTARETGSEVLRWGKHRRIPPTLKAVASLPVPQPLAAPKRSNGAGQPPTASTAPFQFVGHVVRKFVETASQSWVTSSYSKPRDSCTSSGRGRLHCPMRGFCSLFPVLPSRDGKQNDKQGSSENRNWICRFL
jgi:hypothetical protein